MIFETLISKIMLRFDQINYLLGELTYAHG